MRASCLCDVLPLQLKKNENALTPRLQKKEQIMRCKEQLIFMLLCLISGCENPFDKSEDIYKKGLSLYSSQKHAAPAKDVEEAKLLFFKAAQKGSADAEYMLGRMHHNGDGFPKSYVDALDWYLKASSHGSGNGSFMAAMMYYEGRGVPKNDEMSLLFVRKGVEQGSTEAKALLGHFYFSGELVPQSNKKAHDLLLEPASKGDEHSLLLLSNIYATDRSGLKSEAKFKEALVTLSNNNRKFKYLLAEVYAGRVFEEEFPQLKNPSEAIKIFNENLDDSSGMAEYGLGASYLTASGVGYDLNKGREYLSKAADKGLLMASDMLCDTAGDLLKSQSRLDDVKQWCLVPAEKQNKGYSQYVVGSVYTMQKSYSEALEWITLSYMNDYPSASKLANYLTTRLRPAKIQEAISSAKNKHERLVKVAAANKNNNFLVSNDN